MEYVTSLKKPTNEEYFPRPKAILAFVSEE